MPALDLGIDPSVLGQIGELPQQVLAAVGRAQQAVDDARAGATPDDALSSLLSTLGSLPGDLGALPDVGDLLGGLTGITDLVPVDLPDAGDLGTVLTAVTDLFGPVGRLLHGDPSSAVEAAVEKVGDLVSSLTQGSDAASRIGDELTEFLRMLGSLDDWDAAAPSADEVAALLARVLIGVGPDVLGAPATALQGALTDMTALVPDGHDLAQWRAAPAAQLDMWRQIEATLDAGGDVDWTGLEVQLQRAGRAVIDALAVRDRLVSAVIDELRRLDLGALDEVAAALRAVPAIPEVRLTPILDGMRSQVRGLRDGLQAWQPDAGDGRALVRELVRRLLDMLDRTPLGQARRMLLTFEQRVLAAIDGLPLRGLADDIVDVLREIADAAEQVDLDEILGPIRDFGTQVHDKLAAVGGTAVQDSIGRVWDTVDGALGDAAGVLEQLGTALESVTGPITQFTSTVQPALAAVTDVIATVQKVVDAFDLAQPAAAVVDLLHRARDTVSAIDLSVLPADAVHLVKQAADALADIDVAGAITPPLVEILDQIDPGPLLGDAAGFVRDIAGQLQAIDPSAIAKDLDGPVDTVLAALAELDPTQLRTRIDELLAPVRDTIGRIDATELLAPATTAFADLLGRLDAALDPGPLFEPLQDLFQPVIDLVEAIAPNRILELITPHGGALTGQIGGAAGPPAPLTAAGGALARVPSAVDASDELFGFRPGDLLVPLIDLHQRLVTALDALDASVVDGAAAALHDAFTGRLAALTPDAVLARIEEGLAAVEQEFGAVAVTSRVVDAALAYQRVTLKVAVAARAVGDGSADAQVAARITGTLPSLDPLRLVPQAAQTDALTLAATAGRARADVSSLRAAFAGGATMLGQLLPEFLGDGVDGAGLRGALRALDPAPIRDEINELFDDAGRLLAGLEDFVTAALEEAAQAAEELLLPLNPSALVGLAGRAHQAVLDQVNAISPAALEGHIRLVYGAVRRQLEALDPATLVGQVDAIRTGLLDALDSLLDGLLPDPAPFRDLQTRLAGLRPSELLGTITAALKPVTDLVAAIDPDALIQPLLDGIARIRDQLPDVISQIEAAFDEVLHAFPEGGGDGGASISGSIG